MATHKAKCDRCRYGDSFTSPLRSYELPDAATVAIETTFVWCDACRAIRWGEILPDLVQLEGDLASARAEDPQVIERLKLSAGRHITLDELLADHIDRLRRRVAWRRSRKSPPRCLECGSLEVTPLRRSHTRGGSDKWILQEHPGCGGTVTVVSLAVLALDRRWIRYGPEGGKQQAYEMYPSRGAVPIDEDRKNA